MEFKVTLRSLEVEQLVATALELGCGTVDELFEQVGLGERLAPLVARHLLPPEFVDLPRPGGPASPLAISGTEGLVVSYARCCFPIPYEPIIAFLSSGRGVVVHRANCPNLDGWHKQPEKWLPVQWEENVDLHTFTTELKVLVQNRPGSLAAVAASVAATQTNIGHVSVVELDEDTSAITLELQVIDRTHLARVIRAIRKMPEVESIERSAH
jgi:(p)ppGpp synthase/HD superfamily hydrolase